MRNQANCDEVRLILLQMLTSVKWRMDCVVRTARTHRVAPTVSATMDIILTTTTKLVMVSSRLCADSSSQYVERSSERMSLIFQITAIQTVTVGLVWLRLQLELTACLVIQQFVYFF